MARKAIEISEGKDSRGASSRRAAVVRFIVFDPPSDGPIRRLAG
jgi:hypothetical protein